MTVLPPELGQLTALERLDLSYNQLTALPDAIGALGARLRHLNLRFNVLTALPASLVQCTALELLDVRDNKLTALARELSVLPRLLDLRTEGNALAYPPSEAAEPQIQSTRPHLSPLRAALEGWGSAGSVRSSASASSPTVVLRSHNNPGSNSGEVLLLSPRRGLSLLGNGDGDGSASPREQRRDEAIESEHIAKLHLELAVHIPSLP